LHPIIRIASFFLLIIGLAVAIERFIVLLPFLLFLLTRCCTFASLIPLLKRLRWLLLSLFILHLWFSGAEFSGLPSLSGLITALKRTAALVMMIASAHILMSTTPLTELIAALQWWFTPLNNRYFSFDRLAVRLALVLDTVNTVQELKKTTSCTHSAHPFTRLQEWISQLLIQVVTQAEHAPLRRLEIPQLAAPPGWQWSYPALMLIFMLIPQ